MPETRAEAAIETSYDRLHCPTVVKLAEVTSLAPDKVFFRAHSTSEGKNLVSIDVSDANTARGFQLSLPRKCLRVCKAFDILVD